MQKLIKTLAAGCLFSILANHATAAEKIVFGIALEPYPPFSEKAGNGAWSGFEPDLIQALCQRLQAQCPLKEVSWDGLIPALQSSQIDVILNSLSITEERQKVIDFTAPYYQTPAMWVADKSMELVTTPEGLKGKLIGVQGSTSNATYLKVYYSKGSTLRYYNTQDDMTADLQSGRIDVMLADALTIEPLIKSAAGSGLADKGLAPKDPLFGSGIGAAVRKGDDNLRQQLNTALAAMKADGTYDKIRSRYFSVDISAQ
ncbi:transporter substrate-binding domain-containing protein [Pseudomonas sp. A-B-19]|uniref:transporter substrate-binding domain-containing protein n=1 Tax=Pseudomonas sp. A-B-19 TaxID=2832405 RepID=UPI001CBAB7B9|nr:transporter substrate-binding domain-containing protein [Pseudomonas sp. A-B-19]